LRTDHKTLRKPGTTPTSISTTGVPAKRPRSPTRFKPSATIGSARSPRPIGGAASPSAKRATPKASTSSTRSPTSNRTTTTSSTQSSGVAIEPDAKSGIGNMPPLSSPNTASGTTDIVHDGEDDGDNEGDDNDDINDLNSDLGDDSVIMMETPSEPPSGRHSPIDDLIASLMAPLAVTAPPANSAPLAISTPAVTTAAPFLSVTSAPAAAPTVGGIVETKLPAEDASTPTPPPGPDPSEKELDCSLCLQFVWCPIRTPCNHVGYHAASVSISLSCHS
jgi:hypothetical protein